MFKKFVRHKTISVIFILSAVFILGGSLWAYFSLRNVGQPLVLHFNDLAGITQIGSPAAFLAVGFIALLAILFDFILAVELESRDRFLSRLLAVGALFLSVLLFIGYAAIISVN